MKFSKLKKVPTNALLVASVMSLVGCHTDMWNQAKVNAFQESEVFPDKKSAQDPIKGTIARGHTKLDDAFYTGYEKGKLVKEFPIKVTHELMKRGKERYNIFCTPCHGATGHGDGMISKRGLDIKKPSTYHTERLRNRPVGHFYDVITNGYGLMMGFTGRIDPKDRWAIAAYIRALQLSQNANISDVPSYELKKLQASAFTAKKKDLNLNDSQNGESIKPL